MSGIRVAVPVRMGSSRFPGKILKEVNGLPLLGYLVARLRQSRLLDGFVIAISENVESDPIEDFCRKSDVPFYRGSENDVLGRVYNALRQENAAVGGLVYGDCPLIDPRIVDRIIAQYLELDGSADFVSNDMTTSYPPGMEVEIFSMQALAHAQKQVNEPLYREHVTLYLRQNPEIFNLVNIQAEPVFDFPDLEIEVDQEADFLVISEIISHFSGRLDFSLREIIEFLSNNPSLSQMNSTIERRWKQFREN